MSYTLESSPRGIPVLVYSDEKTGKKISIHSAYNPENEAKRLAGSFDPGRSRVILVTGIGLGHHAAALKEKFPDRRIIILERDRDAVRFCTQANPASIEGATVVTDREKLLSVFDEYDISTFKGFRTLYFRTSYSIDPEFYDGMISELRKLISSKISDLLTRFEFEELWAENIIRNIPKIVSHHRIIEFFGRFTDYPGVIISAGPSLRKNIAELKKIQDRAVLVCVDTALPVVEKFGIKPHFVLALDAQKHTLKHFLPHMNSGIPLIADAVSCPRVSDEYNGKIIFSSTAKYYDGDGGGFKRETTPFMDWLEKHIPSIGDIQSGGSVATTAFDLILNLGCSSIILIGQDLAYTGREIHSSGTHHNDSWLPVTNRMNNLETINQKIITRRKTGYVAAYGGEGTVISDFVLDMYRHWFEDSAARVTVPVYNVTGSGARIGGCIEKSLSEIPSAGSNSTRTPEDIISSILSSAPERTPGIRTAVASSIELLSSLIEKFGTGETAISEIAEITSSGETAMMLRPFLKKTNTIMNRNTSLAEDEAAGMYRKDVIRSCMKLKELFSRILPEI